MDKTRLIVVGNGMAGLRFLEELEALAPHQFDITVIGAEPDPAYNRVLLSSLLAGDTSKQDIAFRSRDWYRDREIDLVTGVSVNNIDRHQKIVSLSDGSSRRYDQLVLATGSQPIVLPLPGHELKNVLTFRNLTDVERLQETPPGANTIVIGGGLLGLETAYGLKKLGANVTLIHLMDKLMERQLDAEAAQLLKEKIEAQGITILLEANTESILGDGKVESIRLQDGRELPAELLVMAVGIMPEVSLAKDAGLETGRGIIVDDVMTTSDLCISALGECAEHNGIAYGLVEPLYQQAAILAKRLVGDATAVYSGSSISTNLKVSGIEIFSAGEFEAVEGGEMLVFRDPTNGIYKKLQISHEADGVEILIGAVLVGDRDDGPWYADLIANKTPVGDLRDALMFGRDLAEKAA